MKNKNILLVSANNCAVPYPVFPLGLSCLAGHLANRLPGYDVRVFDLLFHTQEELSRTCAAVNPDYVGVSLRNIDDVDITKKQGFGDYYKTVVKKIRDAVRKSRIIVGGSGFSIFPREMFDMLGADFGICGEGETPFVQLVNALDKNLPYHDIPGLVYRDLPEGLPEGRALVHKNPPAFTSNSWRGDLRYDDEPVDHYWKWGGMINIQTKRGCPGKCIYCTYPLIEGSGVRVSDPDSVVDDISRLYHEKKIDFFYITDSIFNIDNDYNSIFVEKLLSKNLSGLRWAALFSPKGLDINLLKLFKKAGLTHMEFGTDSLSDIQLERYKKGFTVPDILESSQICNSLGIYFAHFLILGGYGETRATLEETIRNSRRIKNTVYFPFRGMRIYPGTLLYDLAKRDGVISDQTDLINPEFYVSQDTDINSLGEKVSGTGHRWVFPEEDLSSTMEKMRRKNRKGPLWEYLIK